MTEAEVLAIKAAVRERDGFRCTRCGMTRGQHYARWNRDLEVHRLDPGGLYSLDRSVTLCKDCHGKEPKRPAGTPDLARPSQVVSVPPDVYELMKTLADRECRPIRSQVVLACREQLRARGLLPSNNPPPDQPDPS